MHVLLQMWPKWKLNPMAMYEHLTMNGSQNAQWTSLWRSSSTTSQRSNMSEGTTPCREKVRMHNYPAIPGNQVGWGTSTSSGYSGSFIFMEEIWPEHRAWVHNTIACQQWSLCKHVKLSTSPYRHNSTPLPYGVTCSAGTQHVTAYFYRPIDRYTIISLPS